MKKRVARVYRMADEVMLERAQQFHDSLEKELAAFTLRFPWLDAVWLTDFQLAIEAADGYPTDKSGILDQQVLMGDVELAMRQGYAALTTLGDYAKIAFPTDKSRQRSFGQNQWTAARFNSLKLQQALELAHGKAQETELKTALLPKGYTQADIDALHNLSEELKLKNSLQQSAKLDRPVNSHDRIALLNLVWQHLQTINVCAKVVWMLDTERGNQYKLYPSKAVAVKTHISITVADGNGEPLANVAVKLANTKLPAQRTNAKGLVVFADASIHTKVDVRLRHANYAERNYEHLKVKPGQENELQLMV